MQLLRAGQGSERLPQASLLPLAAGAIHSQLLGAGLPSESFSAKSQPQALNPAVGPGPQAASGIKTGQGERLSPSILAPSEGAGSVYSQLLGAGPPSERISTQNQPTALDPVAG